MVTQRSEKSLPEMVNPVIDESNVLQREGDQENNFVQPVIVSNDPKKYKCRVCESVFSAISNRRRHEKNLHGFNPEVKQTLKCSECTAVFHREKDIIEHFKEIHADINISEDIKTFDSIEEFRVWKENMEKETASSYICKREKGPWKTFTCHRSGVFISESTGKRHLKLGGSNKTGFYCPAKICYTLLSDGKVNIKFLPRHIGHECEVGRLRLSMTEKKRISMTKKVISIRNRHKLAENHFNDIEIYDKKENQWIVPSFSSLREMYVVKKIDDNPQHQCKMCCESCHICIHQFRCSCRDSAIRYNMCKHIHMVSLKNKSSEDQESTQVSDTGELNIITQNENEEHEKSALIREIRKGREVKKNLEKRRENAKSVVLSLIPEIEKYTSEDQFKEVVKGINVIKNTCKSLGEVECQLSPAACINPPTKNIEKQRERHFPQKKKRKLTNFPQASNDLEVILKSKPNLPE